MNIISRLRKYGCRRAMVLISIRMLQRIRVFYFKEFLSDNIPVLRGVKFNQPAQFVGLGKINLDEVTVGVWPSPSIFSTYSYFEARSSCASIRVGKGTFFNNGAVVIADRSSITIGERCLIGNNFRVTDSDFHGLHVENRNNGMYECAGVTIGNDVFFGSDVQVMKGVSIGDGAVIGSGSLVVKDVTAMAIHAGVPARFIRNI